MVHPDVVLRNVGIRFGSCARYFQIYGSWDSHGKILRKPHFGPLFAAPLRAFRKALFERGERKIQKDNEGQFVAEKIVHNMRRRIVARKKFIEGKNRTGIEICLLAKFAIDFVHVAMELFEKTLVTQEHSIQHGRSAGEIGEDKFLENRRVTILSTPELSHLTQATFGARRLVLAVLRDQLLLHFCGGVPHPWRGLIVSGCRRHSYPREGRWHRI